ncbi:MAG: F0F1 ATP synthase subunit B [Deltaproteobacteria bacterium]|nr:F0F1 ATP synthase subunit B [Deltaproteobacteria bacterium]
MAPLSPRKSEVQRRLIRTALLILPLLSLILLNIGLLYASSGGETGHGAAAGGHGAAAGESPARIMDLILRSVNFVIFFVVLFLLLRKPLKQAMANRREGIQKELDELEQKKEAAKRELAIFESRIAGLKEERDGIIKDFQKEAEREKQKIIDTAQKTAARIVEQAQITIQQEIRKSNQSLREEVAEMSIRMAEEILRKNITDSDQKVLIGEYLAKVVTH